MQVGWTGVCIISLVPRGLTLSRRPAIVVNSLGAICERQQCEECSKVI